jgi:hypothetical protein
MSMWAGHVQGNVRKSERGVDIFTNDKKSSAGRSDQRQGCIRCGHHWRRKVATHATTHHAPRAFCRYKTALHGIADTAAVVCTVCSRDSGLQKVAGPDGLRAVEEPRNRRRHSGSSGAAPRVVGVPGHKSSASPSSTFSP